MFRIAPEIPLNPSDRAPLERLVRSPHTPQGVANRARIVLAAAEGLSNQHIGERLHISSVTVGKWRGSNFPLGDSGRQRLQRRDTTSQHIPKTDITLHPLS